MPGTQADEGVLRAPTGVLATAFWYDSSQAGELLDAAVEMIDSENNVIHVEARRSRGVGTRWGHAG
jgi:hypothetical protein